MMFFYIKTGVPQYNIYLPEYLFDKQNDFPTYTNFYDINLILYSRDIYSFKFVYHFGRNFIQVYINFVQLSKLFTQSNF